MYTTTWCPDCRRAKRLLTEHGVAFEEINIEQVEGAAEWVAAQNQGKYKVPTFELDGRTFACSPFHAARLRRELGLATEPAPVSGSSGGS
ncbi:MAG: glutaredoxin family protein [Terriglobales bacterium]